MPKALPKKRGRPRKAETTIEAAATPKRRGRPPKIASAGQNSAPSTNSSVAVPPKRRGRPPKTIPSSVVPGNRSRVTRKTPATKTKSQAVTKKALPTVAGGYAITCKAVTEEWPNINKDDLGLDISESSTSGVYEASFDFGVLQGAMVLSADEQLLKAHIQNLEDENEEDDEDGDDEASQSQTSVKKAPSTARSGLVYQLQWRGVGTDKETYSGPYEGEIKFTNKNFKRFSGSVDLAFVGGSVEIKGERVTDESNGDASEWNDYGEKRREPSYACYKDSNNWGYDRWGKWGFIGDE